MPSQPPGPVPSRCWIIASDARLNATCYPNDQIWEIQIGTGEPPALAVQTNYGLRVRSMRIFPRFREGSIARTHPDEFDSPPRFLEAYPNYCAVGFSPLSGIDVLAEYWVPGSQILSGRIRMTNTSILPRDFVLEMVAQLITLGDGQGMAPQALQVSPVLQGQAGGLSPVLFITGGPETGAGPYPSLVSKMSLAPGSHRQLTWALVSLPDLLESFETARRATARPWEAELARIRNQNRRDMVDIESGNPELDLLFALGQRTAYRLFQSPGGGMPFPSFTATRLPDQGYSRRGDGSDYSHLWSGQPALQAYALCDLLLPGGAALVQGVLRNYLAVQEETGGIDWKPGLAGQRGRVLAPPILAAMAWRIFQTSEDRAFLEEVFRPLCRYLAAWFTPEHDRDGDGFPEWDHIIQSGCDENPLFDRWHPWGQGVDIQAVENPALGAFLYKECRSLERIGRLIGRSEEAAWIPEAAERLRAAVQATWDDGRATYRYRDRDTHDCASSEPIYSGQGAGQIRLEIAFPIPRRVTLAIRTSNESTRPVEVQVHGLTPSGEQTETFSARSILWMQGRTSITTRNVFASLSGIDLRGLDAADEITIRTPDLTQEDLTLLLPLWAGIPDPDQAGRIAAEALGSAERFSAPCGLRLCPPPPEGQPDPIPGSIHSIWNLLMIEGLLEYGYRVEAAGLLGRVLQPMVQSIQAEGAFHRGYQAATGLASGERDHIEGLAPAGLFLEILGVRLVSPQKVVILGNNPFSWPVTVKYRGLKIVREASQTRITFPGGETTRVTGPGAYTIFLSQDTEPSQTPKEEHDAGEPRNE